MTDLQSNYTSLFQTGGKCLKVTIRMDKYYVFG